MKVALVYDRVNKWGGAERVLLALHKLFPQAPLYTSVYNAKNAAWANDFAIKTSFLQRIPGASSRHELLPLFMPIAFESFSFDKYDVVISITSEAAKGIITKPTTKHICYCLTPTRYLWSGYDTYFPDKATQTLTHPAITSLRMWDKAAAQRPDVMIAISDEVKTRIKKFYQRDATIIYPPTDLTRKHETKKSSSTPPYYLVVSRLSHFTRYKRIDLAVEACTALKLPLKIIGTGNWQKELQAKAGPTVQFLGSVPDEELAIYYKNANALLFPGLEDFGLTVVEAQRFGTPVIAFRGGGAKETIKEGRTGIFFNKQTKQSLMQALRQFDSSQFNEKDCKLHAAKFGFKRFEKDFLSLVQNGF